MWEEVERTKNTELVCCVRGPTKESTTTALEDFKKEIGVYTMVNSFIDKYVLNFLLISVAYTYHTIVEKLLINYSTGFYVISAIFSAI